MAGPVVYNSWSRITESENLDLVQDNMLPKKAVAVYGTNWPAGEEIKRHTACDECRKRKLKCSGDASGCARCVKQKLVCHYSEQKQMGRPRKKQKLSDVVDKSVLFHSNKNSHPSGHDKSPDEASKTVRRKDRDGVHYSQAASQYVNHTSGGSQPTFSSGGASNEFLTTKIKSAESDATPPSDSPPTPYLAYPPSMSQWPDYSTMTQLPQVVADNHMALSDASGLSFESLDSLPKTPPCPCLPSLYLTLSTLATVATFPISNHTVESLQTAIRTAHSVLYCDICPRKFQTGIQNVMLLGTLLNVLSDGWNRILRASASDLRKGFSTARQKSVINLDLPLPPSEELAWRRFAHNLVRAYVFGDGPTPLPLTLPDGTISSSSCPFLCPRGQPVTLSSLIDGMDRRQNSWHNHMRSYGEFPPHPSQLHHSKPTECMDTIDIFALNVGTDEHLCLKIVSGARAVMQTLDLPLPTCEGLPGHDHSNQEECQRICGGTTGYRKV